MVLKCSQCDTVNPDESGFCTNCGSDLRIMRNFLSGIPSWRKRLRFDKGFKWIWIVVWTLPSLLFFVETDWDFSIFFQMGLIYQAAMWITLFVFAMYMTKAIPTEFEKLIIQNKSMFISEDSYKKYVTFTQTLFKRKGEKIWGLILGLLMGIVFFVVMGIMVDFAITSGGGSMDIPLTGIDKVLQIISQALNSVMFATLIPLVFSTLFMLFSSFKSISVLGSKEFPLKVTYKDMKMGAFQEIGKFIVTLCIPALILTTILSIIGLFFLPSIVGWAEVSIGLVIMIILVFLLYFNTLDVHDAILKYKFQIKNNLINQIQNEFEKTDNIDYEKVTQINVIYEEVAGFNDWPFNPKSVKKLLLFIASSVLPFTLSLFGITI